MLSDNSSSPSSVLNFPAANYVNPDSVGFSGNKKNTQATDIKFGDTFRTITSVFSDSVLKEVNQEIKYDNRYFRSNIVNSFLDSGSRIKKIKKSNIFKKLELFNNGGNPMFTAELCSDKPIQFDNNGHLMNKQTLKDCLATSSDPLRTLCAEALEKMADEFQWRDRSVVVKTISLIRYPLIPSRGIKGMGWHRDFGKKSMVVQLNDNINATGTGVKYSGGGLNIGKKSEYLYSLGLGTCPVKGTVENYSYGKERGNVGVIFSNEHDLIHQAEDIVYLSENNDDLAEKRIIVVFVDDTRVTAQKRPVNSADDPSQHSKISK